MKKILLLNIILLVFIFACRKIEKYSDIPEIKLISFTKYQDETVQDGALLVFYFQDGDGDIGFYEYETALPRDFNFFCDYYEKENGVFLMRSFPDSLSLNAYIPRLSDLSEESISGEIYLIMTNYYDNTSPFNDTIQIKFYIVDRKYNKSNVETAVMIR